jgi:hypothetical protein
VSTISVEHWEALVALDQPVGTCPMCGAAMKGEEPIEASGRLFLDARCVSCGHETTAPGGRRKARTTVVPFRRRTVEPLQRAADYAERAAGNQ